MRWLILNVIAIFCIGLFMALAMEWYTVKHNPEICKYAPTIIACSK